MTIEIESEAKDEIADDMNCVCVCRPVEIEFRLAVIYRELCELFCCG